MAKLELEFPFAGCSAGRGFTTTHLHCTRLLQAHGQSKAQRATELFGRVEPQSGSTVEDLPDVLQATFARVRKIDFPEVPPVHLLEQQAAKMIRQALVATRILQELVAKARA